MSSTDKVKVQCPECGSTGRMRYESAVKDRTCPKCNRKVNFRIINEQPEIEIDMTRTSENRVADCIDTTVAKDSLPKNSFVSWLEEKVESLNPDSIVEPDKKTVTCPTCNGEVAPSANACPHCGEKSFDTRSSMASIGEKISTFGSSLMQLGCFVFFLLILWITYNTVLK